MAMGRIGMAIFAIVVGGTMICLAPGRKAATFRKFDIWGTDEKAVGLVLGNFFATGAKFRAPAGPEIGILLSTEYDKTGAAETLHVAVSWNGETLLVQSCTRSAEGAVTGLYQCFDALMRGIADAVIERRLEEEENGGSEKEPPIFIKISQLPSSPYGYPSTYPLVTTPKYPCAGDMPCVLWNWIS